MSTQTIIQQVQWQDLRVKSEVDVVFEIAKEKGWLDCEIFGHGDMITQSLESMGWNLIPADLYEDSIPAEGVMRICHILEAGVRIQGIIIADDQRKTETPPAPPSPKVLPAAITKIQLLFGRAWTGLKRVPVGINRAISVLNRVPTGLGRAFAGLIRLPGRLGRVLAAGLGQLLIVVGKVLFKLIGIAVPIAFVALAAYMLVHFPLLVIIPSVLMMIASTGTSSGTRVSYDPKLVVLVEDGTGGTTWVSVLTWYD